MNCSSEPCVLESGHKGRHHVTKEVWNGGAEAADLLSATGDELIRLRDLIEKAPHGSMCGTLRWFGARWERGPEPCNCWKVDVL